MVRISERSSTHSNCLLHELDFAEIALEKKLKSFDKYLYKIMNQDIKTRFTLIALLSLLLTLKRLLPTDLVNYFKMVININ